MKFLQKSHEENAFIAEPLQDKGLFCKIVPVFLQENCNNSQKLARGP